MRRGRRVTSVCFLLGAVTILLLTGLPSDAHAAGRVSAVSAEVYADAGIPAIVQMRMEKSVGVIAEQLLVGRAISAAETDAASEAETIRQVFDKVLVGYTADKVTVVTGEIARVRLHLVPWADTIRAVHVRLAVDGMPPLVEALVRRDMEGMTRIFDDALIGLPVAASDWTNGALKHALEAYMTEHLPEFRPDFEVTPGETAEVQVTVYPRLPVVRTNDLSMRSDTVPNMALLSHRRLMQDKANMLVGVPVAFVERHRAAFETMFAEAIDAAPDFRAAAMQTKVHIVPSEQMQVMSRSDTTRYRLRLTGWLDIGRSESGGHKREQDMVVRLHAGQMLSQRDEAFLLLDVMPQDVDWRWELGYARTLGSATAQIRYDMRQKRFILGAAYPISPVWTARYEYRFADRASETALRYKIHDFLGIEYAVSGAHGWVRLIGNF